MLNHRSNSPSHFDATRYIGDAVVRLSYDGDVRRGIGAARPAYRGEIYAGNHRYHFRNLGGPTYGATSVSVDEAEAFSRAAAAAVAFAIGEGGPAGEAIDAATQRALDPSGRYRVQRARLRANPSEFNRQSRMLLMYMRSVYLRNGNEDIEWALAEAIEAGASVEQIEAIVKIVKAEAETMATSRTDDLLQDISRLLPEIATRLTTRDNPTDLSDELVPVPFKLISAKGDLGYTYSVVFRGRTFPVSAKSGDTVDCFFYADANLLLVLIHATDEARVVLEIFDVGLRHAVSVSRVDGKAALGLGMLSMITDASSQDVVRMLLDATSGTDA